ncbi:MAG: cyclic nucleotide-binding domain-containing protein [Longimicrobiales bacterium]|nr:cyclic nucleotide-binding domain-containing protein [Longimicrobiales bacterium]
MSGRPDAVGPLIHLRTLSPFHHLSPAQVSLLTQEAEEVAHAAGSWLVPPGEAPSGIYMLLDGYARVVREEEDRIFEPWSLLGYPDVLIPGKTGRGIRAETDVFALRLGTDDLRDLCERHFAILATLLSNMADEVLARPSARSAALVGAGDVGPLPFGESLDRVGRMVALQRAPVLPQESMDALAELSGRVDRVDLAPGEALWSPTAAADGFFVVCTGAVDLGEDDGSSVRAGLGSAPGFLETLCGQPYRTTAEAAEDATLLRVGIDPFMDVAEDHFELGYAILGRMARWLG